MGGPFNQTYTMKINFAEIAIYSFYKSLAKSKSGYRYFLEKVVTIDLRSSQNYFENDAMNLV